MKPQDLVSAWLPEGRADASADRLALSPHADLCFKPPQNG